MTNLTLLSESRIGLYYSLLLLLLLLLLLPEFTNPLPFITVWRPGRDHRLQESHSAHRQCVMSENMCSFPSSRLPLLLFTICYLVMTRSLLYVVTGTRFASVAQQRTSDSGSTVFSRHVTIYLFVFHLTTLCRMVAWLVNNKWERMWNELVKAWRKLYSGIFLKGLRKLRKNRVRIVPPEFRTRYFSNTCQKRTAWLSLLC
jgi:hypothetical protein